MVKDMGNCNVYGVIMAGGGGTRFWPLSRQSEPKQLLNLSGKNLMINETIDRITSVIPKKDIFIVTNKNQVDKMREATSARIATDHILAEPAARNTAACIGYAAIEIIKKYGDGVMCIFPSDHYIKDEMTFANTLQKAIVVAENTDSLLTIGITPNFPSTGYGYIKYDKSSTESCYEVVEFKEKPDYDTAKAYVDSGEYAWNSGMFVWRASVILEKFKIHLPSLYADLMVMAETMNTNKEYDVIDEIYPKLESISIDYGIMEKSQNVKVIPAEFGWSDVGSWDSLGVLYDEDENGNISNGEYLGIDSNNCIVYAKNKLVATVGVSDIVVVETDDAIMVCPKDKAQDVKKIVDELKLRGKDQYL